MQASTTELGKLFQIFTMRAEKNAFVSESGESMAGDEMTGVGRGELEAEAGGVDSTDRPKVWHIDRNDKLFVNKMMYVDEQE